MSQPMATNGPLAEAPMDKATEAFQQPAGLDLGSLGTNGTQPQLYSAINGLGAGGIWPNFNPQLNEYLASMYAFPNQPAGNMTQSPELTMAAMNSMRAMMGYYDPATFGQTPQAMPAATQPGRQQNLAPGGRPADASQQRYGAAATQQPGDGAAAFGAAPTTSAAPAMTQAQQNQAAAAFAAAGAPQTTAAQLGGMPYYQQPYFYAPPVQQFGYPATGAQQPSLNAYNQRGYGMSYGAQGAAGQVPAQATNGQAAGKSQQQQAASANSGYYGGYGFGPETAGQTQQSQLGDYNKNLYGMGGGFGAGFGAQDASLGMGGQQQQMGGGQQKLGGYGKVSSSRDLWLCVR